MARQIVAEATPLNEAVKPWAGYVNIPHTFQKEIKKDWTDGELVEVDWAWSPDGNEKVRKSTHAPTHVRTHANSDGF